MSLPVPLAEFPIHILEGLRKEGPHDPATLREWVLVLSGWLFRLAHLEAESHGAWLDASLKVEEALAHEMITLREQGMSVSAAEKYGRTLLPFLQARSEEVKAETEARRYRNLFSALKEAINAAKKGLDSSQNELRFIGGQPS